MTRKMLLLAMIAIAIMAGSVAHAADTLAGIRGAGVLRCASNGATEDYTRVDSHGDLTDLSDVICMAVAVAVLGPKARTAMHVWPDELHMMTALHAGSADLAIGAAPTIAAAVAFGAGFAPPVFYDGQALLVRTGIASLAELAGKQVCFVNDASLAEDLRGAMGVRHVAYLPFPFEEVGEMLNAASGGHCAAITGNVSQLINLRLGLASIEKRFHLLPELLTRDPLAPAFRSDDRRWGMVVTAVVDTLLQADESGVTAANARQMQGSDDPAVQRLIGPRSRGVGRLLGLPDDWALTVIAATGNYGEIYDRTLGAGSDFQLPRGANQPWTHGGAMAAWPLD